MLIEGRELFVLYSLDALADAWWIGLILGGQVRCGSGSVESVSFEYEEAVVMAVVMAAEIMTRL